MIDTTQQPYHGLKVVDFSQGIAGPYCAEILLQNGASVIKVESLTGDWGRTIGQGINNMNALAIANNLGKRSISVDFASEKGRKLMRQLADTADVVVEGFRPGVMKRMGLSYEDLSEKNPKLIYVSVTGFGGEGPYVDRPGSDSTLQALGGLMVANRDAMGNPQKVGFLVVDVSTGIYAAQAAASALYRRATQGVGAHVEVSLLDATAAMQGNSIVEAELGRGRPARPLSVPSRTFRTADGYLNVTSLHDRMFKGLCRSVGKEEWASDPRFATSEQRFDNKAEIESELEKAFLNDTNAHWLRILQENSVVSGPVCGYDEFLADPQVEYRKLFEYVDHQGIGKIPVPRVPGVVAPTRLEPSPNIGDDTIQILKDLGLSAAAIEQLLNDTVVAS